MRPDFFKSTWRIHKTALNTSIRLDIHTIVQNSKEISWRNNLYIQYQTIAIQCNLRGTHASIDSERLPNESGRKSSRRRSTKRLFKMYIIAMPYWSYGSKTILTNDLFGRKRQLNNVKMTFESHRPHDRLQYVLLFLIGEDDWRYTKQNIKITTLWYNTYW